MKNISFSVHPLAAAGLLFVFLMPAPRPLMFLLATLSHEAAHVVAAYLFSSRVKRVTLTPFGVSIGLTPPRSYVEEICVSAAGPAMNFLICAVIRSGVFPAGAGTDSLFLFSLTLGALNIIPVGKLDGGTVFSAAVSLILGREAARRALDLTSAVSVSILWLIGVYIFFYGGENFALLAFSSCLFVFAVMKSGEKKNNS